MSTKFLTTRELARMWLVSEATIKRWADAGHLRPNRTLGGHRRFALEEVARFEKERGLGVAAAPGGEFAEAFSSSAVPLAGGKKHRRRRGGAASAAPPPPVVAFDPTELFFEAVTGGDEDAATTVLLEAYLSGLPLARILDENVTGAMHRVGDRWHSGEMSVADEHIATRTAIRALEAMRVSVRRRFGNGRVALCCAVESELHDVAVLCAQVLLESEGWTVKYVGAHTPFFALTDALKKERPALVCVSSTTAQELDRGAREYAEFHAAARELGARIVLGGEIFRGASVRKRFPADLYAESFGELLEFVTAADWQASGAAT